jgi:hypothetical protein
MVGSFDIDTAIQMHLVDCVQCRDFTEHGRPVPNVRVAGNRADRHCDTYWQLQKMRADYEGAVNNIVDYTEYGDQAAFRPRNLEGQNNELHGRHD